MKPKFLLSVAAALILAVLPCRATVPSSTAWLQYTLSTNPQALPVSFVFQNPTDLLVLDSLDPPGAGE